MPPMTADRIEFYRAGSELPFASIESPMVPPVGSKISILEQSWKVVGVTYALDHLDEPARRCLRANVNVNPMK